MQFIKKFESFDEQNTEIDNIVRLLKSTDPESNNLGIVLSNSGNYDINLISKKYIEEFKIKNYTKFSDILNDPSVKIKKDFFKSLSKEERKFRDSIDQDELHDGSFKIVFINLDVLDSFHINFRFDIFVNRYIDIDGDINDDCYENSSSLSIHSNMHFRSKYLKKDTNRPVDTDRFIIKLNEFSPNSNELKINNLMPFINEKINTWNNKILKNEDIIAGIRLCIEDKNNLLNEDKKI